MSNKFLKLFLLIAFLVSAVDVQAGLRSDFLNNQSVICGINIRNFNSNDLNGDGIIGQNEEKGTFINAIKKLDYIKEYGINTLHLLPVTPVGKMKALGTAGSLYAISDFESVNEQLVDKKSELNGFEQAKLFIDECHKRDIRVIIDLPSCGSYDLYLKKPELFIKDEKQLSVIPADWTDVRLLNTGDDNNLNEDLINLHKKFIDMVMKLGADGIRADVATIKPYGFWQELITYARAQNSEFLFLAEASDSWKEPPSKYAQFTPYDKLLEAGFDGYYGSFSNLKDWKANDLYEHIKFNKKLLSSYATPKSVILSFTSHDEISPILIHGEKFSEMICWLDATLPFNPYVVDGFIEGDTYTYTKANSKIPDTQTDDDYFFVHKGQLDIFNFSRKSVINNETISKNYKQAIKFRKQFNNLITKGEFTPLKTNVENDIFAYTISDKQYKIFVIGNLNFSDSYKRVKMKLSSSDKKRNFKIIHGDKNVKIKKGKLYADVKAGEIKVLLIENF